MRKAKTFLTIFLLLFSLSLPSASLAFKEVPHTQSVISSNDAITLARLKLTSQNIDIDSPFDEIKATLVQENTKVYWYITFFLTGDVSDQVSWAKVEGEKGIVVDSGFNEPQDIHQQWTILLGSYINWSLETKALFDKIYLPSHAKPINILPTGKEPINQEKAFEDSKKALISTLNLTEVDLSSLFISRDCLLGSDPAADSDPSEGVWAVYFHESSQGPLLYQVNISSLDGSIYLLNDNQGNHG